MTMVAYVEGQCLQGKFLRRSLTNCGSRLKSSMNLDAALPSAEAPRGVKIIEAKLFEQVLVHS